jgi:hypothetical protein
MTSISTRHNDIHIFGLSGIAVRVGTALQEWGTRSTPVTDRDEIELRHWAENEAELAMAAKEAALQRELGQFIR